MAEWAECIDLENMIEGIGDCQHSAASFLMEHLSYKVLIGLVKCNIPVKSIDETFENA